MRPYSEDEIISALEKAPPAVQDVATSPATARLIATFGNGLQIDQIGKVAELNRNMLIGLLSPQELLGELTALGIESAQAQKIMSQINQQIFIPLRQQMQQGGGTMPKSVSAPVPSYQPPPVPRPAPPQMSAPPQATFTPPQASSPLPPRPPVPQPQRPTSLPPTNLPGAMQDDHLLPDHSEPHINVAVDRSAPPPPLPRPQTPQAPPTPIAPTLPPQQKPVPPPAPNRPSIPSSPGVKYSIDPYREPLQ